MVTTLEKGTLLGMFLLRAGAEGLTDQRYNRVIIAG